MFFSEAGTVSQMVLDSPNATPNNKMNARVGQSFMAIHNGDSQTARGHYEVISPFKGTLVSWAGVSADQLLGLLAHTMGDLDASQPHFEDALAFCRKAGYRPGLAWSLCDYADMLLERNDGGDHDKAMSLLDESLQKSTELGMRPLMERVLSRREILKA